MVRFEVIAWQSLSEPYTDTQEAILVKNSEGYTDNTANLERKD